MFSRLPITVSAPLLVGIPVLAVGLWLSVMWNRQSRDAVVQLADQNIAQIHEMAATKVVDELSIPVRICRLNEHLVRSGALPPGDLDAWRATLVREAEAFDMLSAISWGAADGRTAWISRYDEGVYYWAAKSDPGDSTMREWRVDANGAIPEQPSNTFEFDLFSRPWFQAPRDARQPTWSEPFVWVGGGEGASPTLGISYGIPLYDPSGTLIGIMDADFSLNDLSRFLRSIEMGKHGVGVLVGHNGTLLGRSNEAPLFSSEGQQVVAEESSDRLVRAAADFLKETAAQSLSRSRVDIEGEPHYVLASPVGKDLGLDWTLVTLIPERDFVGNIEQGFQRSWLISLFGVALAVMAGLVAARWLVRPLVQLVTAVRRIGQGDLETQVNIRHAPEYNHLAAEINNMTLGLQDRLRMRESLSLAMEVQQNLLPSEEPSIAGLDIAGHSTYCDETGGDYYDFLDVSGVDEETAVIALGDVMGHGVAAAMLMATARGILRSRCSEPASLSDFLDHLNQLLVSDTAGERFMTMLLMTVSGARQELRWASAGHGPPIVYDARSKSFPPFDGGGMPLGIMTEAEYEEYLETRIGPGHVILAATDGLWETTNEEGVEFGMDRVRQLLQEYGRRPAAEISEAIRDALANFRGPAGQDDDLTFVIVRVV